MPFSFVVLDKTYPSAVRGTPSTHKNAPGGFTGTKLDEKPDHQGREQEQARETADLGDELCQVVELELERGVFRVRPQR